MVPARAIENLVDDIARQFNPERIILFGSYAYGTPNEDSDVDLMVVLRHRGPGHRKATAIRLAINVPFSLDLIVRSCAEIHRRAKMHDWFIIDVLEQGLVLYDSDDQRMGAKGRIRLRRRLAAAKVA